jgi:hypothetical protein
MQVKTVSGTRVCSGSLVVSVNVKDYFMFSFVAYKYELEVIACIFPTDEQQVW